MNAGARDLVVGVDGLVGGALFTRLVQEGGSVLGTTRRSATLSENRIFLDLTNDLSEWRAPSQVCVAYLCAAVSSPERCRTEPAATALVNVHNTVTLATKLAAGGSFVIFPSTDLVYDGSVPFRKADDPVCPLTESGRQKAKTEEQLLALGNSVSVVRMTRVFESSLPLFEGWIQALRSGEPIHPFSDLVHALMPLTFVLDACLRIAERRLPGIIHVSGQQDVSYDEVARYIAMRIGADSALVQPVTSHEAGLQLESIRSHKALDISRLRSELGMEPPDVWSTVDAVLRL